MSDEIGEKLPYQVGKKPYTVTIYERTEGGMIRESRGHTDFDRALEYAKEQHEKLKAGLTDRPTIRPWFSAYKRNHTPTRTDGQH